MDKGNHQDSFGSDPVDEPVTFYEELTDFHGVGFRDNPSPVGQGLQGAGRDPRLSNQGGGVEPGVTGNELRRF